MAEQQDPGQGPVAQQTPAHRTLWLLRHADASAPIAGQDDFERPLSARGQQEAAAMANQLSQLNAHADWMLVSSAQRTSSTAQALVSALQVPGAALEFSDALYLASADRLLDAIRSVPPGIQSLAVIAHNPGISELATRCHQVAAINFAPMGCAHFRSLHPTADWSSLTAASFQLCSLLPVENSG